MGERVGALRRFGGPRFAAVAALTALLTGGFAVPSYADEPATRSTVAGTDLTGDGRPDVISVNGDKLTVLPAGGAPYTAGGVADRPGAPWSWHQVSFRGSATGGTVGDLYAFNRYNHELLVYRNSGGYGEEKAGYFTKAADRVVKVAKPATCAAGSDCTGYDPTWDSATQVIATDGIANADGVPDVVAVEGGKLWYYPGRSGGGLNPPVRLGTGDWTGVQLAAPGRVGGEPTLWAHRPNESQAVGHRLRFGPAGLPVELLASPTSSYRIQSAERDANGGQQCFNASGVRPCDSEGSLWQQGTDGTLREAGRCLALTDGGPVAQACTGQPDQRWQVRQDGAVVAPDGRCLTVLPGWAYAFEACDGTTRQSWGARSADPASGPAPFPAPLGLITLPEREFADPFVVEEGFDSQGDLDGDGRPELITSALSTLNTRVTLVREVEVAADGAVRFGRPVSLGELGGREQPSPGRTWNGSAWDVFYSACASLKVENGGSLVVTELATGRVLWSSNTPGHRFGRFAVRADGGIELRDAADTRYWSARPDGASSVADATLWVQDDCNVVLRDRQGTPVWSTRTYDPAHEPAGVPLMAGRTLRGGEELVADRTALAMQADGNLVLTDRQAGRVLWASGTGGSPGASVAVEGDGNVVLRDSRANPLWSTGSWGAVATRLVAQRDGNLVAYDADGRVRWASGTSYDGVDTKGAPLHAGRTLRSGETVASKAGRLVMQPDGNLVLYSKATGNARWSSQTWGNPGATVTMQADGNLVVRAADGSARWSTGTYSSAGAHAVLQDDLDLVVYDPVGKARWQSGTDNLAAARRGSLMPPGYLLRSGEAQHTMQSSAVLTMQSDGNLVLTKSGTPVWASGTWGHPGASLTLQADGNAVVHDAHGDALWSTRTWSHPGAYLVLQHDGNLVLYDADGAQALWATNTWG
ncbi:ricin-type beta-trefoil lectin domain protein [Kitasatospora sp. NPDC004289]